MRWTTWRAIFKHLAGRTSSRARNGAQTSSAAVSMARSARQVALSAISSSRPAVPGSAGAGPVNRSKQSH